MVNSGLNILVDTGFWIALYNPEKEVERNTIASRYAEQIIDHNIVVPFPSLYEFVNSKLSRREAKHEFKKIIERPNVFRISDSKYNEKALDNFFVKSKYGQMDVSLVDEIMILMLEDKDLLIHYIVSFDQGLTNQAMARGIMHV
ncbi:hypothetical protein [Pedobacter nutrimenti]|uniref:hypothetical protein n=1 Tax=Pedobacter nutrimenti TaxID=1241337 RepID=UPI00292F25F6|nr:hypothetical protein [Pedobacter nutrimenti]